jgi:IMP dehydrogenase
MYSVFFISLVTMTVNPNSLDVGLTYDDVLLVPQQSAVQSRDNVSTATKITPNVTADVPIISSNMSTVTESDMAQAMSDVGAVGIIHRFMTPEEQAAEIEQVDGTVGASVGVNEQVIENVIQYRDAGADFICVDIAHGHLELCVQTIEKIRGEFPDVDIIAGNVVTADGAIDLIKAGANSIKVGVGGGSACRTRTVTGVGVPQFTAVCNVVNGVHKYLSQKNPDFEVTIIADGGIRTSGDMMKALMAGADSVMVGGFVAGCPETPGETIEVDGETYQEYSGMASRHAREDRTDVEQEDTTASEGAATLKQIADPVEAVITEAVGGIKSGCSYCGGQTIEQARQNAEFMQVSPSTVDRNGVHSVESLQGY